MGTTDSLCVEGCARILARRTCLLVPTLSQSTLVPRVRIATHILDVGENAQD